METLIRKIIHVDLDAFFCAVEEQRDPSLIGKPFAVGGKPQERGVVSSCSYAARAYGVRSAMPMARALRLCPNLLIVPPHFKDYHEASQKVMEKLREITPLVEQISIDEAFLDVSDLSIPAENIANLLQIRINTDLGLPCSFGVAANKLVAKIASDFGKSSSDRAGSPNAITVVPPGSEAFFLAPLPTRSLWGIGPKTAGLLEEIAIKTIGDLAATPEHKIKHIFGNLTHQMHERALGIDHSPIITIHEPKSISLETTFARDISDKELLKSTIRNFSGNIGQRLRESNLSARTIKLKLRRSDFTTKTRQMTLYNPTNQDQVISETACMLFEKFWENKKPVRLIGLGVTGFVNQFRQLSFWDQNDLKNQRLQKALNNIHEKYGTSSVNRGDKKVYKEK